MERFLDELRRLFVAALVVPARYVEEVFVVALSFAFFSLVFFAEVTTARFVTVECVVSDKFAHNDEVLQTECLVELHVHAFTHGSRNVEVFVEFLTERFELGESGFQTFLGAAHAHEVPKDVAQFLVD